MDNRILILVMTGLGMGLALNPYTSGINPGLVKGASWFLTGILSKILK